MGEKWTELEKKIDGSHVVGFKEEEMEQKIKKETLSHSATKDLIWKLTAFTEKIKQPGISFLSPPFSFFGYTLCFSCYPGGHGAGKGTHLSIYMKLCRGEKDGMVPWPFKATYKFCILNQLCNSGHFEPKCVALDTSTVKDGYPWEMPKNDTGVGRGWAKFCKVQHLVGLVHEDSIVICATVTLNNPWLMSQ